MERQLKVLFLINSLACGGAERVVATLANFWVGQGWQVTIVSLETRDEDFYSLDVRVERVAMNLAGPSNHLTDALLQNGRRIVGLRHILKEKRPDIAISIMSTPNVLLAVASYGIPMCAIGSEHCFPPHSPLGRIWNTLRKKTYGRLSAVVALTRECADWIEINSSARHVPVIPNPIAWPMQNNPPRITPQSICSPGRKILLAVGRLEPVKNLEVLIKKFSQLAKKFPDWDLVILGEGHQRSLLESTICSEGLEARVFIPGLAGNVGEWYEHADLYVMTSQSEGFPNSLAEALAHGLPAVSFDCDTGPRDIIRDGIDGLLVAPNDSGALVNSLERVMGNPALRKQMSVRASEAKERFSIERVAGMWEALFHEMSGPCLSSKADRKTFIAEHSGP